jgi:hypothetical protein
MGQLRTFYSETECGRIAGNVDSKLLTDKGRLKVLHKLGGKPSNNTKSSTCQDDILQKMEESKN